MSKLSKEKEIAKFFNEAQKGKMKEIWDNKEDEEWENA